MTKTHKAELRLDDKVAGKTEESGEYAKWLAREEKSIAKHTKIVRLERSLSLGGPRRLLLESFRRTTALLEKSFRTDERKLARMKRGLER